jgi:hypothetical protein
LRIPNLHLQCRRDCLKRVNLSQNSNSSCSHRFDCFTIRNDPGCWLHSCLGNRYRPKMRDSQGADCIDQAGSKCEEMFQNR